MLRRYLKDSSGNVAMMFAIGLLVIITAVGAAVDFTRLEKSQSKLQNLTDSLTLSAAVGLQKETLEESDLDAFAKTYLGDTGVDGIQATWTMKDGELSFFLESIEDMIFLGIVGDNQKNISAAASVPILESRNFTLALVLDTTLSMQGTRMTSLKKAAGEMINVIRRSGSDNTYVSVVPFAERVKIPVSYGTATWFDKPDNVTHSFRTTDLNLSEGCRIVTTGESQQRICDKYVYNDNVAELEWNGCMVSRQSGYHKVPEFSAHRLQGLTKIGICNDNRNRMSPMTNDLDVVASTVSSLRPHGETYIPSGLIWGWRTLEPEAPLIEVQQAPADHSKVMIVMTDGANSNSLANPVSGFDGLLHTSKDVVAANTLTSELCEGIKNDAIEVYTIALEVSDVDTVTLMENCATSKNHFYDVSDADKLSEVFQDITTQLADIRLSN